MGFLPGFFFVGAAAVVAPASLGATSLPTLLPVTVQPDTAGSAPAQERAALRMPTAPARAATGTIEIEIGAARVRLRGSVDDASVRSVLRALSELA